MDSKLAKYERYKSIIGKLILLSGIWPYPKEEIRFYRIISTYGIFIFSVIVAKSFFFCLANVNSVSMLVRGLGNFLSLSTLLLKLVIFVVYREDLMILENDLGKKFEDELKNEENRPLLLKRISVYMKFMYLVATFLFVSLSMYTIVPIVNIITKAKYIQIYYGKYPFEIIPGTLRYWMVLSFELSAGHYIWTVMNGVDNVFGLHCFRISGLLRLTGHRYRQLRPYDPHYRSQLRECIRMHQFVLRAKEALQSAFGIIVLWTYVTSAIIMCCLLWQANQIIDMGHKTAKTVSKFFILPGFQLKKVMTPFRGFHFSCYVTLKLLQAFTYAYYGSLVSRESESYEESIYTSNWPGSGNVQFMKDLLMIRSQRTITLKALGFFIVTMQMFEKIVHTTISYFFLLQTVESNN